MSVDESMEGWFTDPYQRHEARWMSQGTATRLVRDGNVEGSDPVTDEPFKVTPVMIEGHPAHNGSDMLRADDAEREPPLDPEAFGDAAFDAFLGGAPLSRRDVE
jgi:hypothetical protein